MQPLFHTDCRPPWLTARFPAPQRIAGWSLNRPGLDVADTVAWLYVDDAELGPAIDPRTFLDDHLARAGLSGAAGLMTARSVDRFEHAMAAEEGIAVEVLATLGLSNGVDLDSDGWPRDPGRRAALGTINLLVACSSPLADGAMLECLSIAAMARTAALLDGGDAIVGTGTDCTVIAAPVADGENPAPSQIYAGLHTAVGRLVTATVWQAVRQAKIAWRAEGREPRRMAPR